MGLRLPKDARGWGMPAILWFCLAPYIVLGALSTGARFFPEVFLYAEHPGIPVFDILALCQVLLGIYVAMISMVVMAPAITRERERETWETLRVSVSSPHEILLGLLVGRVGPILGSQLIAGLLWVLLRPHYAPLLQPYSPFRLEAPALALLVWEILIGSLSLACLATAFSVYCRTTGLALVLSASGFLLWAGLLIAGILVAPLPGPLFFLLWSLGTAGAAYSLAARGLERSRA